MPNKPAPYYSPFTNEALKPEEMKAIFPDTLIAQEMSQDRYIEIPDEVRDMYRQWRPTPLFRARNLEKALDTPARIYYKYEGVNATGSHKLNSALPQAYYNKKAGIKRLATETGAGQWGTALSMAFAYVVIDLIVYMVKVSSQQKPHRKAVIETYGAKIIPSPSDTTEVGRKILAEFPETGGSLGCAISEAIEVALKTQNCRYVLGSVLNHVLLHQSVIGLEAKAALDKYDVYPDVIIGCAGGGSNLGGRGADGGSIGKRSS
jgi:tryptophan synthase beta chain